MSRMVVIFSLVLEVVGRLLVGVVAGGSLHRCDELECQNKATYFLLPLFLVLGECGGSFG